MVAGQLPWLWLGLEWNWSRGGKCPRTVKIGPTILWQTALAILMTFNIFGLIKSLKEDQPLGLNTNS